MIGYYLIRTPLDQIAEEKMMSYLDQVSENLREPLEKIEIDEYLNRNFALIYAASGGSEEYYLEIHEQVKHRPVYILTSGDCNSLAASMEILSFIHQNGGRGEILHGTPERVAQRIRLLDKAYAVKNRLSSMKMGYIGQPSEWLISSLFDEDVIKKKSGIEVSYIPLEELVEEYNKHEYESNEYIEEIKRLTFDSAEMEKALELYGAFKRICVRYDLKGMTVRCFDLLDSLNTTGCLGLSVLNSEGIYAGCEGDVPALISMAILGEISGEPNFLCNPCSFDTAEKTGIFAHCTVPVTMPEEYSLNTHFESGIGVAVQGTYTEGECTVFKCDGMLNDYFCQEGEILPMDFSELLCRTQIKVTIPDESYYLTRPIGNHHIICRGHVQDEINTFFEIMNR